MSGATRILEKQNVIYFLLNVVANLLSLRCISFFFLSFFLIFIKKDTRQLAEAGQNDTRRRSRFLNRRNIAVARVRSRRYR